MTSDVQDLFVDRLKEEMRRRNDMSINALARLCRPNVGYATLSRILAGKQDPTLTKAGQIATALGLPLWSLLVLDSQVEQRVIAPPRNVVHLPSPYPKIFSRKPEEKSRLRPTGRRIKKT